MKKMFFLLLVLIFAAPAWAAEKAGAPAAEKPTATASAEPAKEAPKKAKKKKKKMAAKSVAPMGCPTGCALMACPTQVRCCNITTHMPC